MLTINQLCRKVSTRKKKLFKSKVPYLFSSPQRKGICLKVFVRSPKKPNSALRKVAKFKLSNAELAKQAVFHIFGTI